MAYGKKEVYLENRRGKRSMKKSATQRNSAALLNVQFMSDWHTYFMSIHKLIIYTLGFLIYVSWSMSFLLEGVLTKFWRALVQSWPQLLLLFAGHEPDAVHSKYVDYVILCLVWIAVTVGLFFLTRKAFRELRGLLVYSRADSSQASQLYVSKFLKISLPVWLYPSVVDAPSPTTVLDLVQGVQGQKSTTEAWSREVATALEDAQKEVPPAIRIRLSLAEKLTITLSGLDGKQISCTLQTPAWVPLLAYLAIQNPGEWVQRDIL